MKPVTSWDNQDEAWTNVVEGIAGLVNRLDLKRLAPPTGTTASMSMRASEVRSLGGLRTFALEVEAANVPQDGYIGFQTLIYIGSLAYDQPDNQDEFLWPETVPSVALRAILDPEVSLLHGALSGLIPPLPVSHHVGPLVRLTLQCEDSSAATAHRHPIYLFPMTETQTNGAGFMRVEGSIPADVVDNVDIPGVGKIDVAGAVEVVCNP